MYVYYVFQKKITKTVPRKFDELFQGYNRHCQIALEQGLDLKKICVLEIGAGWDLFGNLLNYCRGVERQLAIDLNAYLKVNLLNEAITYLMTSGSPDIKRRPQSLLTEGSYKDALKNEFGIDYRAPCDARNIDIPDASIDFIVTTSVFEHIPKADCIAILREFRRVLAPSGSCSFIVDYSDHYAHSDESIGRLNYCLFSSRAWRKYNPGIHYQNRLRHSQWRALFVQCGFEIIEEVSWKCEDWEYDPAMLDPSFRQFDPDDLKIIGCHFVIGPGAAG